MYLVSGKWKYLIISGILSSYNNIYIYTIDFLQV